MALPKSRTRSIRARIALLLVVPMLSLVGLWGFAVDLTLGKELTKRKLETTYNEVGMPSIRLAGALQYERKLSAVYLASHQGHDSTLYQQLTALRAQVDQFEAVFRKKAFAAKVRDASSDRLKEQLNAFVTALNGLQALRTGTDQGSLTPMAAIESYSKLVGAQLNLSGTLIIADDVDIYREGSALITLAWAREFILQEDTLVSCALAGGGRMPRAEFQYFQVLMYGHRQTTEMVSPQLGAKLRPISDAIMSSSYYDTFSRLENALSQAGVRGDTRLPATAAVAWPATLQQLNVDWEARLEKAGNQLAAEAKPVRDRIIYNLAVAGGIGLLAVVVSITMTVLLVRSMSRELGRLQDVARELAEQRLPWVVARLRRGDTVEVAKEVPPLDVPARTTEVARLADAFNRVQQTAMNTAVGEAHLRKGISRVFLNLAWRSQSLLHRQLRMLDALERRAPDPDTLNDLFQLDHLTTRMRRHAEGLIILSGAAPGRSWSRPVHMSDVLRGAVAEVEDYTRVEVVTKAQVALTGSAVTDIIHLLAELIENATAYSPPPTEVLVHGEVVGNGFAIEIIDRGVGLDRAELAELNERLARSPEFDLADTDRLGLFVVSRLAARHGVRVTLQPSAYGGISAIVILPHALIVPESAMEEPPVPQAGAREPRAAAAPRPSAPPAPPAAPMPGGVVRSATSAAGNGELPKRIRQNSLVPQLRQDPLSSPVNGQPRTEENPERSRDLFSALQAGWQRARDENENED